MRRTFEAFCHDEYATVVNALSWSLGGHDLGREAADEAFARAYERWEQVAGMGNQAGWVYTVGLNWGRRRLWRSNRERELLTKVPVSEVRHLHHRNPDLARALAGLSVKVRSVVVMRMLLDYSELDTAEALGLSPGTVKSRLHRGLAQLKQALGGDDLASYEDGRSAADRWNRDEESGS